MSIGDTHSKHNKGLHKRIQEGDFFQAKSFWLQSRIEQYINFLESIDTVG